MEAPKYPFEIRALTTEEGGGYLITFPDLPGCMSDGETIEEAIANGADAEAAWLQAAKKWGDAIPKPGEGQSGKFVQRLPKSLHARLVARARQEGVSMNTLVTAVLAEALGRKEGSRSRMKKSANKAD
jgi:antitoxin HicB